MLDRIFIDCSVRRLKQMQERIEVCLSKLNEEQIWARGSAKENAAGNLALHLCGNVRQWIVSGVGGAEDRRERDTEFSASGGVDGPGLRALLAQTISEACAVIEAAGAERLEETVRIQNYDVTVLEAIYHVVEHFSGHTGQIVFLTKMLTSSDLGFYTHLKSSTSPPHNEKTP